MFSLRNNLAALNAHRNLQSLMRLQMTSMERISTGRRINRAADDPAGLAMGQRMRAQVVSISRAARNAQDGISMVQTAQSGIDTALNIFQNVRELLIQADSGTLNNEQLEAIEEEIGGLLQTAENILQNTQFNNINLLDGTIDDFWLHIGPNVGQGMRLNIENLVGAVSGLTIDFSGGPGTLAAQVGDVDALINTLSQEQSALGAVERRLGFTIENLETQYENLVAAESRIMDADIALEMMRFFNATARVQAATFVMAQANQQPFALMRILGID